MTQTALEKQNNSKKRCLYMAMELSHKTWKLAFGVGGNPRIRQIPARDLGRLDTEIEKAKEKFRLPKDALVVSCYEAGREGYWIHRYLLSVGVENIIVDSSSIEVSRRKRRAKTDRIDSKKLYTMLVRHYGGEKDLWSVVRVPSRRDEDERRIHRELERLQKECNGHSSRIKSLLILHGIDIKVNRRFEQTLEGMVQWDGSPLGYNLKSELKREYERWETVYRQISKIRKEQLAVVKATKEEEGTPLAGDVKKNHMVLSLMMLCGIGERSAWPLVYEFLWRDFANRREVGNAAGLCGTPYDSGGSVREQGISKVGSKRIRRLMVELSWCWLRYQSDSAITQWFNQRFRDGGKRMRRVGIVAVARRLLIALWQYVKFGVVPEGVRFKGHSKMAA
jgi:transposase